MVSFFQAMAQVTVESCTYTYDSFEDCEDVYSYFDIARVVPMGPPRLTSEEAREDAEQELWLADYLLENEVPYQWDHLLVDISHKPFVVVLYHDDRLMPWSCG